MKFDTNLYFHTDICSCGSDILGIGCHNDGMIHFVRQKGGGSPDRPATLEEHIETGSFTVYSPHPPRPRLIVGPHEGSKVKIIAYPNGSKPRIIILDGVRIQYQTFDYGFSWEWQGVGDPPAGFLDIEQDEEAPAAPL
jgi:hypothetical protein